MREALKILNDHIQVEEHRLVDFILNNKEYDGDYFSDIGSFSAFLTTEQIFQMTKPVRGRHGIYIFVVNHDFQISKQQVLTWNNVRSAPINSKDRYGNPCGANVSKGKVFYIGSTYSTSLLQRLHLHLNHATGKTSLKLQNQHREWIRQYLEIKYFAVDKSFSVDENKIILPSLEKKLHESLQPLAGSNRT